MLFIITVGLYLISTAFCYQNDHVDWKNYHPDAGLNIIKLVKKHGYPIQRHPNIQTDDGYLLEIHRIPHGKNNTNLNNRPVVLIMHGILSSSIDWVNTGPGKGLAYILAEEGYDVWLGNARGNTWSRKHIEYDPDEDSKFWDFSWNEIGLYDLPAIIDYILLLTEKKKIFYVAHSQGSTAFFVMASEKPKYNKKIILATTMAPIAYMTHVPNMFIRIVARFETSLSWISKFLGMNEFMPHNDLISSLAQDYCNDDDILQMVCSNALFLIGGFNFQVNKTILPVILSNTPAGSSTKQLIHFAQEIKSEKFRKFDFGFTKNMMVYGSFSPPVYNLGKVSAPVTMFYGASDVLSSEVDIDQLYRELPNVIYKHKISDNKFGHLDFMWGMYAPELLYNRMIKIMKRFLN